MREPTPEVRKELDDTYGPKLVDRALRIADKIIDNLEGSDFATDYGFKAADGLRDYKTDIAKDLLEGDL